jgi:hypothetical protein
MGTGGGGGSPECTDLAECQQRECRSEYEECVGPNADSGDFGGVCESYMECASDCGSNGECDTDCLFGCISNISDDCQSCLLAAGECGAEECPDEYEACNGESTTTTTNSVTSTTGGGGDGTCEDVEACCNSMEADAKEACLQQLEAIAAGGDQFCGLLLQSYQEAGECSDA